MAREREGEEWARGMEESFLNAEDGMDGKISERELEGFLRGWREGRRKGLRRMEERARWDEGRVGGWR